MRRHLFAVWLVFAVFVCWIAAISAQETTREKPPSEQPETQEAQTCVSCHEKFTPGIVADWQASKHSQNDIGCAVCHGDQHTGMDDAANAQPALPDKCAECHEIQVNQFKEGKHSVAWKAMNAMPTVHWQPMAQVEGMKGCGACHRLGLKSAVEVKNLQEEGSAYGVSSCDTCHTRHLFSKQEAKQPQACQSCHLGPDHPQWEMYSTSKHGTRYLLRQNKALPEAVAAPTCQTCHMSEGNHAVRTAWGYLGVRLPMPDNPNWADDRTTILQALGVLDPSGNPTGRLDAVKEIDAARLTQEAWQDERDRMVKVCNQCHSVNFARNELEKGDVMIREADRLMAEGIRTVAGLYDSGALKKPDTYAAAFPDLLTFHDAPTSIEQTLFKMFLERRMRTFQGAFHASPVYSFWYGWSAMQQDLTTIKERAAFMTQNLKAPKPAAKPRPKPQPGPKPAAKK